MKDIEQAAKDAGVHDSQLPDDFISREAPMPRRTRKRNTLEDLDYIGAEVELLTQRVQELEKALRIARGRMSHSYNCVKVNPTEEWHKDGSVTVGACICEIATVDAALAGTKEQP
jgi:hypothetical protein